MMAANLERLERAAWPLFRAGHLPVIGEWVALPVIRSAEDDRECGLDRERLSEQVLYPAAQRLLERCDGVLRLPGDSTGADQDVATARRLGLPVWFRLADVPGCESQPRAAERVGT